MTVGVLLSPVPLELGPDMIAVRPKETKAIIKKKCMNKFVVLTIDLL